MAENTELFISSSYVSLFFFWGAETDHQFWAVSGAVSEKEEG